MFSEVFWGLQRQHHLCVRNANSFGWLPSPSWIRNDGNGAQESVLTRICLNKISRWFWDALVWKLPSIGGFQPRQYSVLSVWDAMPVCRRATKPRGRRERVRDLKDMQMKNRAQPVEICGLVISSGGSALKAVFFQWLLKWQMLW